MILPCGQHGERWASGAVATGQYDQAEHASRHLDRAPDCESGRRAFQSLPVRQPITCDVARNSAQSNSCKRLDSPEVPTTASGRSRSLR
jgi:hypothetical protein